MMFMHMNTDTDALLQVTHAARMFDVAQTVRDEAVRRRDAAIRSAIASGNTYRAVAEAAGVALSRVAAIAKEGNDA
jgi:hypothetical protein